MQREGGGAGQKCLGMTHLLHARPRLRGPRLGLLHNAVPLVEIPRLLVGGVRGILHLAVQEKHVRGHGVCQRSKDQGLPQTWGVLDCGRAYCC